MRRRCLLNLGRHGSSSAANQRPPWGNNLLLRQSEALPGTRSCPAPAPPRKSFCLFRSLTYVRSRGSHVLPVRLLTKFVTVCSRRQEETVKEIVRILHGQQMGVSPGKNKIKFQTHVYHARLAVCTSENIFTALQQNREAWWLFLEQF